jgi:hypothetical protein
MSTEPQNNDGAFLHVLELARQVQRTMSMAYTMANRMGDPDVISSADAVNTSIRLLLARLCIDALEQGEDVSMQEYSLSDLAQLDMLERARPDKENLLEAIEAALPAAERVDIKRGRCLPETVEDMENGETMRTADYLGLRGTDYTKELVQLRARLSLELYGPTKRNNKPKV